MVQISKGQAYKWNVNVCVKNKYNQLVYNKIKMCGNSFINFLLMETDTYWVNPSIYYQHTCKLKDIL